MSTASVSEFSGAFVSRDRQRISTFWLCLLLVLGLSPFLLMALRLLALHTPEFTGITALGEWLNQHLTLQWVGFEDRDVVLYTLNLPLAALLIALTRLTLGIRVLGFRSILIAIGMQENGVVPCLLLILLIACAVVLVRPSMRRSGMPLYARIAVVLCIVAFTMLSALLAGAWLDSVTLWSMAFFPVVILAMLAESIADTVARDGVAMGVWRTFTTIILAGVLAGLNQFTPLRELLLSCPELLLTPLVLIVFVSEFLDLRLLEGFRPGSSGIFAESGKPQLVVVRNRFPEASPRRLDADIPKHYRQASLQALIDQLRQRDYAVHVLECDSTLPNKLRSLARAAFSPSGAGLCVLNYAGGVQGSGRLSQVPMICEMLGIPHTGPAAQAVVNCNDRLRQLDTLQAAGLGTPEVVTHAQASSLLQQEIESLNVRPRFQADRGARRVTNVRRFDAVCERFERCFGSVVIERVPAGQALTAVVLNPESGERARVLPLLERGSGRQAFRSAAATADSDHNAVAAAAICAARELGCRDVARVDLYCSTSGDVTVDRVLAVDPLTLRSASGVAADLGGLALADIAEHAAATAFGRASMLPTWNSSEGPALNHHSSIHNRSSAQCKTSVSSVTA